MTGTVWFDVEDLFHHFRHHARPSGIQRVGLEICHAAWRLDGGAGRVGFVRHAADGQSFVPIAWDTVAALLRPAARAERPARRPGGSAKRVGRDLRRILPRRGAPLLLFALLQSQAILALLHAAAALLASPAIAIARALGARTRRRGDAMSAVPAAAAGLADVAAAGDVLVVLGSPWFHPGYAAMVTRLRDRAGVRFAVLMHDLIPVRRPEWCDRGVVETFRAWHAAVLPLCDVVFANSRSTAADVEGYMAAAGLRRAAPVQAVPLGTGFGFTAIAGSDEAVPPEALPPPGSYVLFVSTIEARKNHILAFRAWRRMAEELPAGAIPTLVFAGNVGWLVADLMQQLENADYLGGKIRLIRSPSDATLRALYRGCLFTLFPSFHEGWGLPVTESLSLGKPCLASNRTALPEAGGDLARYFDPGNLGDAYRLIRATLADPTGLAAWEEQIRREFRPIEWTETARAILSRLSSDAAGA